MKKILTVFAVIILVSCTKQAKDNFAPRSEHATKKNKNQAVLDQATTVTLTNNGGGSFSIDYGGATDVVWMFFRWGNELSTTSGNVIPVSSQSFYLNPVTTFTANGSGTYYQAVVVTGSTERDSNGVLGSDWVISYSNVVQ